MGTSRLVRARMLMTRDTTIAAPFTGGIATDLEYFQLGLQQTVFAQDLIAPNGIANQRRGWTYDGTTAEHGANSLVGIARNGFVLSGNTRTITTDTSTGPVMIHNPSSAGTSLITTSASGITYLPRCIYRDELIICAQDGIRPILRYSGASAASTSATGITFTAGKATLTASAGSFHANTTNGAFVGIDIGPGTSNVAPRQWYRVLERSSSTSLTLEEMRTATGAAGLTGSLTESALGFTWPAVSIYSAGTISIAAGTVTGTGTKWQTAGIGTNNTVAEFGGDALLVLPPGASAQCAEVDSIFSDTTLNTVATNVTDSPYAYLRRCPFKDAAAHRGSLWGTGSKWYPDRVYVSPPGWNPSLPPGYIAPYDPLAATAGSSPNANDFLLSFVDVPSPFDGDSNIAILPSSGPLLVLKRYSVYGVFGSYPSFQVSLIPGGQGAGCDDIRSAISVPEGQFWAGQLGVFTYRSGQVVELTRGRINREWRARFRNGVTAIISGVVANHLIIRAVGADDVTYVYDLARNVWVSKFSNFAFGNTWRSKVGTEQERLLALAPSGTRVIDIGPVFDVANPAGTARDADGTSPRMRAITGPALAQAAGIDGEAKLLDVSIDANVYDSATPTTVMGLSVTHSGALENSAQRTKAIGGVAGSTTNLVTRTRIRDVNRSGRLHSLTVDVTTTDAENVLIEVPELVMTWRDTMTGT
jgi:hypothetical protein